MSLPKPKWFLPKTSFQTTLDDSSHRKAFSSRSGGNRNRRPPKTPGWNGQNGHAGHGGGGHNGGHNGGMAWGHGYWPRMAWPCLSFLMDSPSGRLELVRWWWETPGNAHAPRNATLPGIEASRDGKNHIGVTSPSYSPQKATSNKHLAFFSCRKNASKWDHITIIYSNAIHLTNPTQRKDTHHPSLASCYKATSPSLGCWWRLEQLEPTK